MCVCISVWKKPCSLFVREVRHLLLSVVNVFIFYLVLFSFIYDIFFLNVSRNLHHDRAIECNRIVLVARHELQTIDN